ncbi:aldose epimerase [Cupriavidus gilardii]|uniref:aldose epimerase family protein n=1 Tax=Cupriavidus gilardii TaxID=82541 RepID=UPI0015803E58|nr:aldose epimerase [Cupriavidus gilardii]MCT9070952.1 aldose epimerase [Cupriavidus gilardii]QKS62921.1 aldose epimerase [Cupriavidus gilardii]
MPSYPTLRFQDQDLIRIGDEHDALLLAPWAGGRLVRWIHRGTDILYWPDHADWSRPAKVRGGNPLLFPFIGRHFVDGEAGKWRDGNGVVRPMPQHGFARDLPFEIADCDPARSITMVLSDSDATRDAYPFSFRFEASYRLLEDGLEVTLAVRNAGREPLPFYAGHHFYFAVPHELRGQCRLTMPPAEWLRQRPDGSLTAAEPGEAVYALDDPRLQDTFHRLHAPVAGACELAIPSSDGGNTGRAIRIDLDANGRTVPWQAVTTWSEREDSDFYCVEPWLALPDAIHRPGETLWVAPGDRTEAVCRLLPA